MKKILFLVLCLILFLLPVFLPRFYIYIASIILLTGLLTTSLNLAIGYGGIYQFHHALFYGLGAYSTALMITKGNMPYMISFLSAPIVSALASFIIGIICIRLTKLYFGMLQISLGSLIWVVVYRWYSFTGGDDGIHGITMPDLISSTKGAYYFTLLIVVVCLFIIRKIINSPFGKTLQAIRDNPMRSLSIGIDINIHRLVTIVIAGLFGGIAGMLFVVVDNSVFPDMMFWTFSLEILIMCLLGGMYTFWGSFFGAAIIVLFRTFISGYTQYWSLLLGIILTLVIIFLPEGVVGFIVKVLNRRDRINA